MKKEIIEQFDKLTKKIDKVEVKKKSNLPIILGAVAAGAVLVAGLASLVATHSRKCNCTKGKDCDAMKNLQKLNASVEDKTEDVKDAIEDKVEDVKKTAKKAVKNTRKAANKTAKKVEKSIK